MLKHCSLETRTNFWILFCRPLLEQTFALFHEEQYNSNKEALMLTLRVTFRKLTMLTRNVGVEIINKFIGYDFVKESMRAIEVAKYKWINKDPDFQEIRWIEFKDKMKDLEAQEEKKKNLMPKELVEYTNLLTAKCTKCKEMISKASHLLNVHNIEVPEPIKL